MKVLMVFRCEQAALPVCMLKLCNSMLGCCQHRVIFREHHVRSDSQNGLRKHIVGLFSVLAIGTNKKIAIWSLIFKNRLYFSLPPDKRLNGKEERRRADPAYEIMESRAPERNAEVGRSKTL